MISNIPLRINITAIEAKNKLVTFDTVLLPACSKNRSIGEAIKKTTPTIRIFAIKAKAVIIIPYSLTNKTEVVRTAGLVINGTPIGTAPKVEGKQHDEEQNRT